MANPPLAGKPPYATDEPDTFYSTPPAQPRVRQQPPPDPNSRTSAYNVYDTYLNRQSGVGAVGMGLMNMADDDDEDDAPPRHLAPPAPAAPIAAPRPGYAAPIAALNLARPPPAATPEMTQLPSALRPSQAPKPLTLSNNTRPQYGGTNPNSPYSPQAPFTPRSPGTPMSVPSTPHPLQPPMTPITPVFARPQVKFSSSQSPTPSPQPIMRGGSEDELLPRRGEKGDDFWRRFSMVVKEEQGRPQSQSSWLKKTQNGTSRLSRWVWLIGVVLLLCIGGAIGLGWYASHNAPSHTQPKAFGGSENESASVASTAAATPVNQSGSLHVTPTLTLHRRAVDVLPTAGVVHLAPARRTHGHRRRAHSNRTWID